MDYVPPEAHDYALLAMAVIIVVYVRVWWLTGPAVTVAVYLTLGKSAGWPWATSILYGIVAAMYAHGAKPMKDRRKNQD